jgi:CRISPR-associated exonuclease Cas4
MNIASRLLAFGVVLGLLGLVLAIRAVRARWARGLGYGKTVALDNVTLFSKRHELVGRPDRIVKAGKKLIPEEWKSSTRKVEPWHIAQLATYFILIEEHYGVMPPYGFVVLGNGVRKRIKNTEELRERVLRIAAEIREARRHVEEEIRVSPQKWQCRVCGVRSGCVQSRA